MSNETTPLVSNGANVYDTISTPVDNSNNGHTVAGSNWKARLRKPSAWLLIPCAILYLFAPGLMLPSQTFIYRIFACQYWWSTNGGHEAFNGGPSDPSTIPDEICRHAQIDKLTSNITAAINFLDATLTIFSLSVFSVLVSKWGRKFSMLYCIGCMIILLAGHAVSVYIRGIIGFSVLVFSVVLQSVASAPLMLLAWQLYVTDTVPAEKRAFFFSLLTGVQLGAVGVATTVGGLLPEVTGLFLSPFMVAVGITTLCGFYVLFFVPESLTPERRAQLLESSGESIRSVNSLSNSPVVSVDAPLHRRLAQRLNIFRPLAILLPSRKPGRRSWSLSLFIVTICLSMLDFGGTYSTVVIILTGTNRYHFGPAEIGMMLSMVTLLKAIFLLVLFPTLVVVGRKWYADRVARQLLGYTPPPGDSSATSAPPNNEVEDDRDDSDDSSMIGGLSVPPSIAETIQANANLFDVFLASGSWLVDAIAFFLLAASSSVTGFLAPLVLVCLGGGGRPAISAYVTEIVPPRHLDRALAALAMLQSLIVPLSMVIFGSLYTLTVDSVAGLSFGIMGMLALAASGLVLVLTGK